MYNHSEHLRQIAERFRRAAACEKDRAEVVGVPLRREYSLGKQAAYELAAAELDEIAARLESGDLMLPSGPQMLGLNVPDYVQMDRFRIEGRLMTCPACHKPIEYVEISKGREVL